jgi:hypothetical protein
MQGYSATTTTTVSDATGATVTINNAFYCSVTKPF